MTERTNEKIDISHTFNMTAWFLLFVELIVELVFVSRQRKENIKNMDTRFKACPRCFSRGTGYDLYA